ncbi:MAG: hypothetical protein Alpg2KO_32410 [Alphaproteobacteria bacterium]
MHPLSRILSVASLMALPVLLTACDIEEGGPRVDTPKSEYDRRAARADLEQASRGFEKRIDLSKLRGKDGIEVAVRRFPMDRPLQAELRLAVLKPQGDAKGGTGAGIIWRANGGTPEYTIRLGRKGNLSFNRVTGSNIRRHDVKQNVVEDGKTLRFRVIECGQNLQVYQGDTLLINERAGREKLEDVFEDGRIGLFMEPAAHARFSHFRLRSRASFKDLPQPCQKAVNRASNRRGG